MNAQTHPKSWRMCALERIEALEQENDELRHDIKRHIASMTVEAEANGYLRTMLEQAQRELGRMEAKQQERVEELAGTLEEVMLHFIVVAGDCQDPAQSAEELAVAAKANRLLKAYNHTQLAREVE